MNVLFSTQSDSVRLFSELRDALAVKLPVGRAGFVVADSLAYGRWLKDRPDFEQQGHVLLKEWDVTARRDDEPDLDRLAHYERLLGAEPGLFGAIVADRRLFMGPDCTYTQDYRRRFTDRQLLSILQAALLEIERVFDELKPDLVVGFICVTMLDYLAYLFARARGIRYLNLRPTRVSDRVTFGSTLNDPTPEFITAYEAARSGASRCIDEARRYIRRVREEHGRYEGVIKPSAAPALKVNRERRPVWSAARRSIQQYLEYRRSAARSDNHVPDPLRALLFAGVVNPLRARRTARMLVRDYLARDTLRSTRYAFYPLHTEPEVSLLVYGRPFLNQIEIIRELAISLPVDMILVVKEHPWMVGKRTLSSYRKLLNIPRVRLVDPAFDARELIQHASLIAVVTGSVALEAAIIGRPVLTFGDCPYNALPETMVQRCRDLRDLPRLVRSMIDDYRNDERALEGYVAATWETSESVSLYSVLLQKEGVYSDRQTGTVEEIERLAGYLIRSVHHEFTAPLPTGAARW